ncbi:hypothetical protein C4A75_11530 [Brevibacillus laterosporus]|uniref:FtsW/RodA/SpoVE family cell cycle protein n=1 Tax=Brevibacillus laterosporus TaxID=1465 RepID=UPI000CE2C407|nr:hypothetical protein C4A75_11530 [Brevibacillus laterosporus]
MLSIFIYAAIFLFIGSSRNFIGFINPYVDPLDSGWIYIQISNLLHSAGLWGQGFLSAFKTITYMDDRLIFVYLIYSFGWVLGIIFLALIAFFAIRITRMIKRVNDSYGKQIITSFLAIFSLTFLGNILMSVGYLPINLYDSIPLPFINDSGVHLIYKFIAIGIIISVYRHKDMISTQAQVK